MEIAMPTQVTASGDQDIDGILWGWRWTSTNLTYSFPTSSADYISYTSITGFEAFNSAQQAAMVRIVANYNHVCGLNITLALAGTVADLRFAEADSINYGGPKPFIAGVHAPGNPQAGNPPTAEGNAPDSDHFNSYQIGDCWFTHSTYDNPTIGSYAYATLMHEMGHALGLKHGHEPNNNNSTILPADHNSFEYSVMTYHQYVGDTVLGDTAQDHPTSLMQDDIAALQYMYGADYSYNNGNTTYTWSPTTGEMFINGVGQGTPEDNHILLTVWDGGGTDTYDFSDYTTNLTIDLNPGAWTTTSMPQLANLGSASDIHLARGNIANALLYQGNTASLIENAVGGSGNDHIIGNSADNRLQGGRGQDLIDGGEGTDAAVYTENFADGTTINWSVDLNLSYRTDAFGHSNYYQSATVLNGQFPGTYDCLLNIENIFTGGGADWIYGNSQSNEIWAGAGDDHIGMGGGTDYIYGEAGTDTALFAKSFANYTVVSVSGSQAIISGNGGYDTFLDVEYFQFTDVTKSLQDLLISPLPASVSIDDMSISEGNSGTKVVTFTVTRTGGTAAFNVNFFTSDGGATLSDGDYVANSGTLQFGANVNTKTISVTINGDTKVESDEAFFVNLSGATNGATIGDNLGIGLITNDDSTDTTAPAFVNDNPLAVAIGATGTITSSLLSVNDSDNTHAQLTYTIVTGPSGGTLLKNGSATSSFTQDDIDNNRITYHETASNVSSDSFIFYVSDPVGNHTANTPFQFQIINPQSPTLSLSPATVVHNEGDAGTTTDFTFLVTLVGTSSQQVTAQWYTTWSSTFNLADFTGAYNGNLSFDPGGSSTQTITMHVVGDSVVESDESFVVHLVNSSGAQINANASLATGTVLNDDAGDITVPVLGNDIVLPVTLGGTATITSSFLSANDPESVHTQLTYTITSPPAHGTLLRNGAATSSFTQADIDNGLITYQEDGSIASSDGFSFNVSDPAGNHTANTLFQFDISGSTPLVILGDNAMWNAANFQLLNTFTNGGGNPPPTLYHYGSVWGSTFGYYYNGLRVLDIPIGSNSPTPSTIQLQQLGGTLFTAKSIDFDTNWAENGVSVTFNGVKFDNSIVTQTFNLDAALGFQVFAFNSSFSNLRELDVTPSDSVLFDNFVLDRNPVSAIVGLVRSDFNGDQTSDILFRNDLGGDTWFAAMSNGTFNGWHQIGGSNTAYSAVGLGDFYGTGTSDVLFRNISTGDSWFEAISNGAFAGWHQIGGSDTRYSAAGVADFYGNATSDILYRNTSTGDTWFEAMSTGSFSGWHQVGGSDTSYAVAGVGDFYGTGTSDILYRNTSTGDTWFEAMSNGAFTDWHQVGGSDTHYNVVGVGDFFGNGIDDVLFRNNSTGDTWFEAMSNGAFNGWHQVGGSDTHYAVVGVGDYFGNGTDDILFRNNSTGDTWYAQMSNGSFNGWHQIGGSDTSYTVKT
jgi:serralysin